MRKVMIWCTGLVLVGTLAWGGQSAGAARTSGPWGRAIEVPGLGALATRGGARVVSVSCASAGNCAAGGHYRDRHGQQAFVAAERHGRWSRAIEVPRLAGLNQGGWAGVLSVSCGSPGNCAAGGFYTDADSHDGYGFVTVERNGVWGKAMTVPAKDDGDVYSISCASAGNCLAGGDEGFFYTSNFNAFFAEERAGHWGRHTPVPGLRTLKHTDSWIDSVACPSAGNCALGGGYDDRSGNQQVFVAVERNGRWGTATVLPGLAALNAGGVADVSSVSCGSPGSCAAGGYYTDGDRHSQGFVAVERNGVWGTAIEVPGLGALNKGGRAAVSSLSCGSAGNCAAGGYFADGIAPPAPQGHVHGYVAVERNGVWGTAIQVPGLAALNKGGGNTGVLAVSCTSAGSCAAGGSYSDRSHHRQGFVASEHNGMWGRAVPMPGLAALNKGGSADVGSLSCPSPGTCAAGGAYTDRAGHHQGYVTQAS